MTNLRVSLVQTDLVWEDPTANCAALEEKLSDLAGKTDVIVLPEMFATGFSMTPHGAEIGRGPVLQWMQIQANRLGALVVGSLKVKQQNDFFNRLYAVHPDGTFTSYDKRHLFRMGGEHEFYQSGDQQVIVSYKGWNIALFVCYDLRFPVWSRNVGLAYDAAIYVANWPQKRVLHWSTLLQARAIENQCFVVGVNRIGTDGNNLVYSGASAIYDGLGETKLLMNDQENTSTVTLSYESMQNWRLSLPFLKDRK